MKGLTISELKEYYGAYFSTQNNPWVNDDFPGEKSALFGSTINTRQALELKP